MGAFYLIWYALEQITNMQDLVTVSIFSILSLLDLEIGIYSIKTPFKATSSALMSNFSMYVYLEVSDLEFLYNFRRSIM